MYDHTRPPEVGIMNTLTIRRAVGIISVALFLSVAIFATLPSAKEMELTLETKIASATVYWGLAHVTRSGRVEVKPGMYRIICDDLPKAFTESSLQVSGQGTAKATVLGVDIVQLRGEVTETPRYRELEERLELLTARRDSLGITLASLQERKAFISNLGSYPFRNQPEEKEKLDIFRVADWKTLIDFLEKERTAAERKTYHINGQVQELKKEIDWITAELGSMRSKGTWNKRVAIDCEVASAGNLDLDLTYIAPGATWEPEYTARYRASDGMVELVYNAKLSQKTGEDWKRTSVMLSTAQPQIGAAPPKLTPYYITALGDVLYVRGKEAKAQEYAAKMARSMAEAEGLADTDALGGASVPIPTAAADAAASEFATNLVIRKAVDLASGADPRRFMVLTEELEGEFTRYAAPRMSQKVYIQGTFTNTLEVPILAGTAEVYIETPGPGGKGTVSNFVGKEGISSVIAGEEFELHLGIDQDMKVEHKQVKKERLSKPGAKTTKYRYNYLITLESFKGDSVTVTLQDRIPVSRVKEVKIADVDLEPKPDEEREDGILTWKLALPPKGRQEITIEYTIEHPGG
jgi:uncharacterized protein (TIGR02231 family)